MQNGMGGGSDGLGGGNNNNNLPPSHIKLENMQNPHQDPNLMIQQQQLHTHVQNQANQQLPQLPSNMPPSATINLGTGLTPQQAAAAANSSQHMDLDTSPTGAGEEEDD